MNPVTHCRLTAFHGTGYFDREEIAFGVRAKLCRRVVADELDSDIEPWTARFSESHRELINSVGPVLEAVRNEALIV